MNFEELKQSILEKVEANDRQWYWYQLDRAIISMHPYLNQDLIPAIRELEAEGLLTIAPNPNRPDLQAYWITEKGRCLLRRGQA